MIARKMRFRRPSQPGPHGVMNRKFKEGVRAARSKRAGQVGQVTATTPTARGSAPGSRRAAKANEISDAS
jgi:hypothetical protein